MLYAKVLKQTLQLINQEENCREMQFKTICTMDALTTKDISDGMIKNFEKYFYLFAFFF